MDTILNLPSPANLPKEGAKPLRVLIADDSENDAMIILRTLHKAGYAPVGERVWTAAEMQAALQKQPWELVLSDYEMPGFGGLEALALVKQSGQDVPFILVSAVLNEEMAVDAMRAGAHDFIMKRKLARLAPAVERELREAQSRAAKRAAEAALRQSEEQLRQAQKLEAVARLSAGVAHDFNNILTAIGGHSQLLLQQMEPGDARRKSAEQIDKCTSMAAGLTRQLLMFSRKQAIEPRVLDLNELVGNLQRMLRRLIGEDIELCAVLDPAAGHIKADPGQLEQVVMNLAVNARDAMPRGGKLTLSTANQRLEGAGLKEATGLNPGPYVVLAVTDTGTGMSEEVKAHLFEPFFTTKAPGKGTGLGLATCFSIAKQNQGYIQVDSEVGRGTTFTLYFPEVQEAVEPVRAATTAAPAAAGGTETVLLVEDDPSVRELAVTALRGQGYTVLEAANGQDGLRVAEAHPGRIDLLLTDVVMPLLGGVELAQALAKWHPELKVLFTSGYSGEVIGPEGLLRPGIEFLQKPYLPTHLAARLRQMLDRAA